MPLLSTSTLTAPGSHPEKFFLFLHGILGRGSNWRSIARRLVQARPELGAVLVDLRGHGDSRGFAPPHSLKAAARDLEELAVTLPGPVRGILGHSFGGKVALTFASTATRAASLEELWIIDSPPSARPEPKGRDSAAEVLQMVESLSFPVASRDAFVQAMRERGAGETVARWLALNLIPTDGGFTLTLELDVVRALLEDHYRTDLWPVVEDFWGKGHLHLVIGGNSTIFEADDRARSEKVAGRKENVFRHTISGAGHWVHADAPEALLALLTGADQGSAGSY